MPDFDKKLRRSINDVKRGVRNLRSLGLKIEIHNTETMLGSMVDHIYVIDYMPKVTENGLSKKVILQKHLFTV